MLVPEPQVSEERRQVWERPELRRSELRVSVEAREPPLFPIEPTRREQPSPRPQQRADPPPASVHLPAAVTRGI